MIQTSKSCSKSASFECLTTICEDITWRWIESGMHTLTSVKVKKRDLKDKITSSSTCYLEHCMMEMKILST